ncbi:chromatin assembly factor 1 subunit A-domain-containing protein [Xylariales sp. AK1849]|nr:chromatin assembly factor 1 subunit A-domain-containing protein [Xylariales sp. AK1849]
MPLFDMSTNVQESEVASRKRSHKEFVEGAIRIDSAANASENLGLSKDAIMSASVVDVPVQAPPFISVNGIIATPPGSSSPAALSESGSSPQARNSPSPNRTPKTSPSAQISTSHHPTNSSIAPSPFMSANPPVPTASATVSTMPTVKRRRKTQAEKEEDERERALKKAKKDEEEAAKAQAKVERDAAKASKAAEKAKLDAEKETKKRAKEEADEKKRRAQPNLFQFLKQPVLAPVSPNKQPTLKAAHVSPTKTSTIEAFSPSPASQQISRPEKSAYEKMFQDFFVKPDVTIASFPLQMTEETMKAKSRILDEYVRNERGVVNTKPFNPIEVFQFIGIPHTRGIQHAPVKEIMAEMLGDPIETASGKPPVRTESQQVRLTSVQDRLNAIPVKILSYYEDVRPAYVGTVTSTPTNKLHRLARRPMGRLLKQLNYDYDSEAEWQEEEGEDLGDDEDDDEENDGDEEMDDFLDDADEVAATRPGFLGESEPTSTGICFEDRHRMSHTANGDRCATVYKYRMEFLLESLPHHHSIDPFSTDYWQPRVAPRAAATESACGQAKTTSMVMTKDMAPPPAPRTTTVSLTDAKDIISTSLMPEFKKAIISDDINFLTKAAMIDMLSQRFSTTTKAQVRSTLDLVAQRSAIPGEKKTAKRWALRAEHVLQD